MNKHRISLILASAFILLVGGFFTARSAFAGSGNQWCNPQGSCLNAWNGGPFVKTYGYNQGGSNNDFTFIGDFAECNNGYTTSTCPGNGIGAGYPIGAFEFTGSGKWAGMCVGDAYNNADRADSSLDPCPSGNNTGGWGVNFVEIYENVGCNTGQAAFWNIHWRTKGTAGGISLGPNGSTVYLNNSKSDCMVAQPPALSFLVGRGASKCGSGLPFSASRLRR